MNLNLPTTLFLLLGLLMLTRKGFLYGAPLMIGIVYRFSSITDIRNFTLDELLVFIASVKIIQELIVARVPSRIPVIRWYFIFLMVLIFVTALDYLLFPSTEPAKTTNLLMVQIKRRFYFPFIYLAAYLLVRSEEEGIKLLRWIVILSIPLSLYTMVQYHLFILPGAGTGESFWLYSWYSEDDFAKSFTLNRAYGTLNHPAQLGRYLMFSILLGIILVLHRTDLRYRRIGIVAAVLSFYALGISGSRGPTIGLGAGLILMTYLERRMLTRNFVFFLILVFGLSFAVPELMSERMGRFIDEGAREMNVDLRIQWWNESIAKVIDQNPLTGLGPTFDVGFDSDFVSLIALGGIVLLVVFFFCLASILWYGFIGIRWGDNLARMAGAAAVCCCLAAMVAGLSGQTFFVTKIGLELFFILGVCNRVISLSLAEREREYYLHRSAESGVEPWEVEA